MYKMSHFNSAFRRRTLSTFQELSVSPVIIRSKSFVSSFSKSFFNMPSAASWTTLFIVGILAVVNGLHIVPQEGDFSALNLTSYAHEDEHEDPAVSRYREYLRIDTSHPNPNYDAASDWLQKQAAEVGLEFQKVALPSPAFFVIVLTWRGSEPNLKSIMFNSHIDTVPVDPTKWLYHPFAAIKTANGRIYARGAQDRKHLGAQYLEAVRGLKAKGFQPMRTVHFTFVPDEELGGYRGMGAFVNSDEFKALNIGMELDEGGATPDDEYAVYYGERAPWQFKVIASGRASHGAHMLEDNAAIKLNKVITKLLDFRTQQLLKLTQNPNLTSGDVTSINLSQLGGGIQANVVPSEMWAIFDMRIKLESNWTFDNVTQMLDSIIQEVGPGVRIEFLQKSLMYGETDLSDKNVWWTSFKSVFDDLGLKLNQKYFAGATDARFLRNANFTALGFSPLPRTEPLQHQDNEYLQEETFLRGISMYQLIIPRLSQIEPAADL